MTKAAGVIAGMNVCLMTAAVFAQQVYGQWLVEEAISERQQDFCQASAAFPNGISIHFIKTESGIWYFGLASDSWGLSSPVRTTLQYSIDSAALKTLIVTPMSPESLSVDLAGKSSVIDEVRNGKAMRIFIFDRKYEFDLRDVGSALSAVDQCVNQPKRLQSGIERLRTPQADSQAAPAVPGVAPEVQQRLIENDPYREAAVFMENLIAATGATDLEVVPRDQWPKDFQSHHAAWRGPDHLVMMFVLPHIAPKDVAEEFDRQISSRRKGCGGGFSASSSEAKEPFILRAYSRCRENSDEQVEDLVIRRASGGVYAFAIAARSKMVLRQVDLMITDAIERTIADSTVKP